MKIPEGRIIIDQSKFTIRFDQLPVSRILGRNLKNAAYEKLGDVHGLLYDQFVRNIHFGRLRTCELYDVIEEAHGRAI